MSVELPPSPNRPASLTGDRRPTASKEINSDVKYQVWGEAELSDLTNRDPLARFLALSFSTDEIKKKPEDMDEHIAPQRPGHESIFVVGFLDGQMVSAAQAIYMEHWVNDLTDVVQCTMLATHPDHRRQGLAKQVIERRFKEVKARHPDKTLLVVTDHDATDAQPGLADYFETSAKNVFGKVDRQDPQVAIAVADRQILIVNKGERDVELTVNSRQDDQAIMAKFKIDFDEFPGVASVREHVGEGLNTLFASPDESFVVLGGDNISIFDALQPTTMTVLPRKVRTAFAVKT